MSKRRILVITGVLAELVAVIALAAGGLLGSKSLTCLGVVAAVTGAIWLVCARHTSDEPMRSAQRRYVREFFPPMLAYMLIVFLIWPLIDHVQMTAARILIALLPVLPIAFVLRAMLRLLLASDELERRMQLEAISIAAMSVGLLSFAAAFLRAAGLLPIENALMLVLPALFAVYGVALWSVKRRYRDE